MHCRSAVEAVLEAEELLVYVVQSVVSNVMNIIKNINQYSMNLGVKSTLYCK